jgi:hypothetical protein
MRRMQRRGRFKRFCKRAIGFSKVRSGGTIVQQAAGLRKLPIRFGKVAFVLHYVILADEVVILRVYHGREQRPT